MKIGNSIKHAGQDFPVWSLEVFLQEVIKLGDKFLIYKSKETKTGCYVYVFKELSSVDEEIEKEVCAFISENYFNFLKNKELILKYPSNDNKGFYFANINKILSFVNKKKIKQKILDFKIKEDLKMRQN